MKILLDTNILISAALFPNSTPFKAYAKAMMYPCHGMICEQTIDEMLRIFNKKFPTKLAALEQFLFAALRTLEVVPMTEIEDSCESQIRDVMDRPILRAAIHANADIIVTGDKDFLESGITNPSILTVAEFLALETPDEATE